jgi:riboflavin kinase/FMN adenylyltransferase
MRIYRSLAEVPADLGPTVATIGNFDGVHCGHQWVIAEVIARAQARDASSLAITFDPHPVRVLHPEVPLALITPLQQRLELLAATGLDATLVLPFTLELSHLSARQFAQQVLHDTLHVVECHEGETFRFGHDAQASAVTLDQLGHEIGFDVRIYAPCELRGMPISSSRVRAVIAEGNMQSTRALLGRPFSIRSTPASGRGYGTRYAVPTINLAAYPELLPGNGVYATLLRIGSGDSAMTFEGVTNCGNRPTFGADSFAVESHLFDFHPVELNEHTPLELTFIKRLRGEQRWPTTEALKEQIGRDVVRARRLFSLSRLLTAQPLERMTAPAESPEQPQA